jgi:precorrin-6B methylase 2
MVKGGTVGTTVVQTLRERGTELAVRWIPARLLDRAARIGVSRFFRLLAPEVLEGRVDFERRSFVWIAPPRVLERGRSRGIENRICRTALSTLPVGGVALDVGSNYGFVSMVMASAVGASGRVFLFEANAQVAATLRKTVARNQLDGVVEVTHAFVGDASEPTQTPPRLRIDDFVRSKQLARVDFLKIDVDGPDLKVLQGARETLERFSPVVVVEMCANEAAIYQFLVDLGYTCGDMSGGVVVPPTWPPNIIASRRGLVSPPPRGGV